jgi:hypothetical protein
MKNLTIFVLLLLCLPCLAPAQSKPPKSLVRYGANPTAGRTFIRDGIKFYYEVYGVGEPLLLVHGNGGSIADLSARPAVARVERQRNPGGCGHGHDCPGFRFAQPGLRKLCERASS